MALTQSHTRATLAVPAFMLTYVKNVLKSAGCGSHIHHEDGTDVIDMQGLALVSERNLFVVAGIEELIQTIMDMVLRCNENAFKSGFSAGFITGFSEVGAGPDAAWAQWMQPDADRALLVEAIGNLADRVPA